MHLRRFGRFWPRRGSRHTGGKGRGLLLSGLLGIGLAVLLIGAVDAQLRPALDAMATAKVSNAVTQTLDGAIADYITDCGLTYGDFIRTEKDSSGRITAFTSEMAALNRLRTGILGIVVAAVDDMNTATLSIPVGNLTGVDFLSGRGFALPVDVVAAGSAHAEFQNLFSDAGINQTRHQIMLEVTVSVEILLPSESLYTDVSAQIPVAETVIVGPVPDTYLQMGNTR